MELGNAVVSWSMLEQSPSQKDGLSHEVEMDLRCFACEMIESVGILLKLPQVASATAQVLLQRFYYTSSMYKFSIRDIVLGSIFLASKIEECPRKIQDIVNVFGYVICNQKGLQNEWLHYVDKEFYLLKDSMFFAEISILGLLGFNVQVQHPHGFMINYLKSLELQDNHDLAQRAWNYLNDSLRTNVVVCYQPSTIACAVIFLASRVMAIKLPTNPPWWEVFDAHLLDLENISLIILAIYQRKRIDNPPLTCDELKTRKW